MNLYSPEWYASETGFFCRPTHVALGIFLLCAFVLFLFADFLSTGKFKFIALLYLPVAAFLFWRDYRIYGSQGKPLVTIEDEVLYFGNRAGTSKGNIKLKLADLEEVVIFGPVAQRMYQFIAKGGTSVESVLMFWKSMEAPLADFLTLKLSPEIKVSVKEPSSFSAAIQGDGL